MDGLKETLEAITNKVEKFRSLYEQNEMAVREQIVTPILRTLGWNTEDPDEVHPNPTTEEGFPDYCLIKEGKKMVYIEVKKLSVDVGQKETMRQLAKYAFGEGVRYGVITNGVVWILVRSFEEGTTLMERVVWKVDLEDKDLAGAIRKFNTISKGEIERIEALVRKIQILEEVWHSFLEEPKEIIKGLTSVFQSIIKQRYSNYNFDDVEIQEFIGEKFMEILSIPERELSFEGEEERVEGRPRRIKLPGESYEIRKSYEILVHTANWLIKKGKLKNSDCPVIIGHKRNLVNTQPEHAHGEFRAARRLSNGLWIETHYSTADCIKYAKHLLERFGYPPDTLIIE